MRASSGASVATTIMMLPSGESSASFASPPPARVDVDAAVTARADEYIALLPQASAALRRVDSGDGVLVLTDLYGATPSNLAAKVARLGTPVKRVSALSLPMLLRVMNYAELTLDELPAVAAAGARNGVLMDDA